MSFLRMGFDGGENYRWRAIEVDGRRVHAKCQAEWDGRPVTGFCTACNKQAARRTEKCASCGAAGTYLEFGGG